MLKQERGPPQTVATELEGHYYHISLNAAASRLLFIGAKRPRPNHESSTPKVVKVYSQGCLHTFGHVACLHMLFLNSPLMFNTE